jgi:predicted deacylase
MLAPIADQVEPRQITRTHLSVEDPESGQTVRLPLMLARGAEDGPVLCALSAQRGIDLNGSAALHLLFRRLDLDDLRGLLIGIPFANPLAARTKRLAFPTDDGWPNRCPHDLAGLWPGDCEASLVERMAAAFWEHCVEPAHGLVDFHSVAPQCGPSVTVRASSDSSVATAKVFGIPHIRLTREINRSALYDVAARHGKAALEVRLPPPRTVEPRSVRLAVSGLRNTLAHLHMSSREVRASEAGLVLPEGEVQAWDAPTDGLVLSHVDPGTVVQEGALVAELISLHTTDVAAEVIAPFRGVVTAIGCPYHGPEARSTDLVTQGEVYVQMARCDL